MGAIDQALRVIAHAGLEWIDRARFPKPPQPRITQINTDNFEEAESVIIRGIRGQLFGWWDNMHPAEVCLASTGMHIYCVGRIMKTLAVFFLCSLLVISCGRADSWAPPAVAVVASPDGGALLRVAPGRLGESGSSATATVLKYHPQSGGYEKVAEFPLRNPVAPHAFVISNGARFIVTLDDWAQIGRTNNAVVVYHGTGEFIKAWSIADIFSEEEMSAFPTSVSSTWWRGDVSLRENRAQTPVVIVQPETGMASFRKGAVAVFDVLTMTFQTK